MEAETNKMAVVVTLGTTHFDGGDPNWLLLRFR